MGKPNLAKLAKEAQLVISRHSPEILTGIGIAGMITSTVLAVSMTPKALKLIEEKKKEERLDKLTPAETVKTTWKCYVPAVATGAVSVACLIGASSVNSRRNAALATAYKLSETALSEYKEKVVETIGEKKEKVVREKVNAERVEKNPVSKNEIIITDKGTTLCYDPTSSRYFKSDIERIKRAENTINKEILHSMCGYASLNEFYDELGLEHTLIGNDLGWNINHLMDLDFSSTITDDGTPCIVIDYRVAPLYGFDSYV